VKAARDEGSGSSRGSSSRSGSGGGAGEEDAGDGEGGVRGEADRLHHEGADEDERREADVAALCKRRKSMKGSRVWISLVKCESLSSYRASFSFLPSRVVSADGAEGKTGENLYVHDSILCFHSA